MKLVSEAKTREVIKRHNLRLQKKFGQNFLIHEPTVDSIIEAAELSSEDLVIEIGPGIGTLTQQLADEEARVLAIELDHKLISVLQENLKDYDNVEIIQGDALKLNFDQLAAEKTNQNFGANSKKYKVVANLPYYITTPIVMHLLENKFNLSAIIIMIQKEVAERLVAKPGKKDYGAITVTAQYYADIEIVTHVPPAAFIPPPAVNSTVIKLKIREKPPIEVIDEKLFFRVVKGAFSQRRKTLLNALGNFGLGIGKEELVRVLDSLAIEQNRRGETLSMEEFAKIADAITNLSK